MATYLLTWNPNKWEWEDFDDNLKQVRQTGYCEGSWSCGSTKKIMPGDRFFLIRLGMPQRGIFASGTVISNVFEDAHWESNDNNYSTYALYVQVHFDVILDPNKSMLVRQRYTETDNERMNWYPQNSGITIPSKIAELLENEWNNFLASLNIIQEKNLTCVP